jgi:hypothetical protein
LDPGAIPDLELVFDFGIKLGSRIFPITQADDQGIFFFGSAQMFTPREIVTSHHNEQLIFFQFGVFTKLLELPSVCLNCSFVADLLAN